MKLKPEHEQFIKQREELIKLWGTKRKQLSLAEGFRTRANRDIELQTVCYSEAESQIIWEFTRQSKLYQELYNRYLSLSTSPESETKHEHLILEDFEYIRRFMQFLFGIKTPQAPRELILREEICYPSKIHMVEHKKLPAKRKSLLRKISNQKSYLKEAERDEFMSLAKSIDLDKNSKDLLTSILSSPKSFTAVKSISAEEMSETVSLHYKESLKKMKVKKANLLELTDISFIDQISGEYGFSEKQKRDQFLQLTGDPVSRLSKFDIEERLATFNKVSRISFLIFN